MPCRARPGNHLAVPGQTSGIRLGNSTFANSWMHAFKGVEWSNYATEDPKQSKARQRNSGDDGRQRETKGSTATRQSHQHEGRQRETKGDQGRPRETKGGKGRQGAQEPGNSPQNVGNQNPNSRLFGDKGSALESELTGFGQCLRQSG